VTTPVEPVVDHPSSPAAKGRRRGLPSPTFDGLFTMIFVLFGWGVGIARLADNSFFWHLRTGELILDGGIPHRDPYSYTAHGEPWVAQSWLAELLYGAINRVAGPFGLRIFGGLLGVAIAVSVFRLALRLGQERIRATLLSLAALAPLFTLWSVRPLVIGLLLLVGLVWVIEVPECWLGRRPLVVLPLLLWLWVNVHGTFALGLAYVGLHLLGRWLEGARPWAGRERALALGSIGGLLLGFANPYGPSLVKVPVDLLSRGDVLNDVIEWSSPNFHTFRGQTFALWIAVFVVIVAKSRARASWRDLVVAVPFLLLGVWALRNIVVAPLVCLPIAARLVAPAHRTKPLDLRPATARIAAVVIGLIVVAIGVRASLRPDYLLTTNPVRALEALEEQHLIGRRLLTDDSDSGYVILRFWPEQRVFFDDRFDMYPRDVIDDFTTVSFVRAGWQRVLASHDVEVVVWERGRPLAEALRLRDDWRVTYRDRAWIVFVRDGVEPVGD
jgi:hypothetical protein